MRSGVVRWMGLSSLLTVFGGGCSPKRVFDEELLARFDARVFESPEYAHPLPYRLFIPPDSGASAPYPLVVYLHSSGGRGDDNKSQVEYAVERLVSSEVQGPHPSFVFVPQNPKGSQWLNTSFDRMPFPNYDQDRIPESDAMKMVVAVLDGLVAEFDIDPDRIYVMGSSMGASGTWDIVARYPHRFAAAITISGVSDPATARRVAHLPIWAFHGTEDQVSDVNNTRRMISALRASGSDKSRFTEYSGLGHSITRRVFEEPGLIPWMFEQVRAVPASGESER